MKEIPIMYFRGGTSKGPCFLKKDLPSDPDERDRVLLAVMGSPHPRQVDGIGSGDSLSSKVVIVGPSEREGIDLDYLLCQVHVNDPIVETTLNCGNMLSAVAPFAIEQGLIKTTDPETVVSIFNENTGVVMESTVQTRNGKVVYEGSVKIDGVPGSGSPIKLTFLNATGSKTGKLLPTGNLRDDINGISVSCVDVAVPMVIAYAESFGKTGYESKMALDNDKEFMERLENVRRLAAIKMGLGDVSKSINPKICIVTKPKSGGTITSRYFTPFDCHDAHAVSGGLCLAAACFVKGSIANEVAGLDVTSRERAEREVVIEHVSGEISTAVTIDIEPTGVVFPAASFIRTARLIFKGTVCIPDGGLQNTSDKIMKP